MIRLDNWRVRMEVRDRELGYESDHLHRRLEIAAFFEDPAENLALLKEYQVEYIFVSAYERSASWFDLNESALEALFPVIYEDEGGQHRIFQVPEEYRQ